MFVKHFLLPFSSLLIVLLLAACGGSTTTSTTTSASSSSTSAGTTPTTAPTSSTPASVIMTATATVKGQSEMVLTNAQGKTLYYFTPDTATKVACTGGCAQAWPPVLFTGSGTPTSSATLPGTLSVITGANGAQVEYSGFPLYTYSGDTAAGQTTGEGLFGKWYVATPDLASVTVRVTTAMVKGKSETILTNAQGKTLYYFTPDSSNKIACTGGCAQAWPPLVFSGSGSPLGDAPLSGKLSAFSGTNGTQVEYNGHPLYTYSGDTAPGQTTGQGLFGKWFVCTPSLAA
jgi:predicted lipoprotein with Yx(FWY)xxD motif